MDFSIASRGRSNLSTTGVSIQDYIEELRKFEAEQTQQMKLKQQAQWAKIREKQSYVEQLLENPSLLELTTVDNAAEAKDNVEKTCLDSVEKTTCLEKGEKQLCEDSTEKDLIIEKDHSIAEALPADGKSSFEKAVEDQLKKLQVVNLKNEKGANNSATKPQVKRPFLKKGTGLQRFLPKPISYPKKICSKKREPEKNETQTALSKNVNSVNSKSIVQKEATTDKQDDKPKVVQFTLPEEQPPSVFPVVSSNNENTEKERPVHKKAPQAINTKETKELTQFEILEGFAHGTSFNSESSFINDVLNPEFSGREAKEPSDERPHVQLPETKNAAVNAATDPKGLEAYIQELHDHKKHLEQQLHHLDEKSTNIKKCSGITLAKEFCDITLSSSDDELHVDRQNILARSSSDSDLAVSRVSANSTEKIRSEMQSMEQGSGDNGQQPRTEENASCEDNTVKADAKQSPISASQAMLREKLGELEKEIEIYKTQNAVLEKLKKQREDELRKIQKDREAFEKYQREEREKLNKEIAEKMNQIRREKQTFERYQKLRQDLPGRKEKEEFNILKQQIESLHEELKKLNIKSNAESKRLRRLLLAAEKERDSLKMENKRLEEQRLDLMAALKAKRQRMSSMETKSNLQKRSDEEQKGKMKGDEEVKGDFEFVSEFTALKENVIEKPAGFLDVDENDQKLHVRFNLAPEVQKYSQDGQNLNYKEIQHGDKLERIYINGDREVLFQSGSRKYISADGRHVKFEFFNGDSEEIFPDQRTVYTHSDGVIETNYPDGLHVYEYPNKQVEKHFPDGMKQITFPDGTDVILCPDGSQETRTLDGNIAKICPDGTVAVEFPCGEKEIRTADYIRHEFADGTIKTIYKSGRRETRFPSGRLKVKDKDGNVLIDTKHLNTKRSAMMSESYPLERHML